MDQSRCDFFLPILKQPKKKEGGEKKKKKEGKKACARVDLTRASLASRPCKLSGHSLEKRKKKKEEEGGGGTTPPSALG